MSDKKFIQKYNKRTIIISGFCFGMLFIILCIISWRMFFPSYDGAVTAEIYQGETLLYTIPLNEVQESYQLVIENENGKKNEVSVSKGVISVSYADCPDQVCVKRGMVSYSSIPIVCMPNQLMIKFVKEGETETILS